MKYFIYIIHNTKNNNFFNGCTNKFCGFSNDFKLCYTNKNHYSIFIEFYF